MVENYKYISSINSLDDFRKLNLEELDILSLELRDFIINVMSKNGGHLASNLGVVELTLALHKVFNSPEDKIVWDVGHQSYVHKIITGRKNEFHTIRKYKGLSGYPKRKESVHDIFETGHSSTSVSAGLGIALARDIKKEDYNVISVIGDGAMTAGMVYEAMNHAGEVKTKFIVVLNDNEMSISKNIGGLSNYLTKLRTAPSYLNTKKDIKKLLNSIPKIGGKLCRTTENIKNSLKYLVVPGVFFEELGFKYLGPIDGHNINELIKTMKIAKKYNGPVLIHAVTKKGKGYYPAEKNPDKFHGTPPFDISTGCQVKKKSGQSYSSVLGDTLVKLAKEDNSITAITAAMPLGTGLTKFKQEHPDRFFDVGIAEQHGVTLSAGLASRNLKPFYAVYSSFLQRGYDQVLHDVCIQNLPVVFALDRAGIVGSDGETHHGVFDFSYLSHIPNMTIMAPKGKQEFISMIEFAAKYKDGPIALRYPRGNCIEYEGYDSKQIEIGKGEVLHHGKDIALIAIGHMVNEAVKAYNMLLEDGIEVTVFNARFLKPLDEEAIDSIVKKHNVIITIEDNVLVGGFGSYINDYLIKKQYNNIVYNIGYEDKFIEHGNVEQLYADYGVNCNKIIGIIKERILGRVDEKE
ncbi:1-deoxy-D-xylulose-5-phosphate synthase [Abyssisolibacter fermentans]|uniref:1-deoxy-D-xylulose-5-phosphate synthase n=1 Tax=Abyssisolibacter fermentans TaxID=1766203 RepID=UPI00082F9A4C|nr:1-deoxy-D-xylulose-5-phosphate synthase [Abyssisolibacter fermentans]